MNGRSSPLEARFSPPRGASWPEKLRNQRSWGRIPSTLVGIAKDALKKNTLTPRHQPEIAVDSVDLLLKDAGRYPLLKPEQEIELAKRIEKGDLAAKDLLINSNVGQRARKVGRVTSDLAKELEREPTVEEVAAATGLTPEEVSAIREVEYTPPSLNAPVGEEEGSELGHLIAAEGQPVEEEVADGLV